MTQDFYDSENDIASQNQSTIEIGDSESENEKRKPEDYPTHRSTCFQDHKLYQTLLEIDPDNINYMYKRCKDCKVKYNQLKFLTPLQINLLIPKDNIGIMAEFSFKFDAWKNSSKIMQEAQKAADVHNSIFQSINRNPVIGNPNSLLNILYSHRGIYLKAINTSEPDAPPKTLTPRECSIVMDLIKNHFVNHVNGRMGYEDMERLADEIVQYFPGEDKFTYFKKEMKLSKDGPRYRSSGKIPNKWNNRRERDHQKREVAVFDANITIPVVVASIENPEEQESIKTMLADGLKLRIDSILENWKKSSPLRLKFLSENRNCLDRVFQEWPMYGHNDGYILILEDFDQLYPTVVDEIQQNWAQFFNGLKVIYNEELPDEYHAELVNKLDNKELTTGIYLFYFLQFCNEIMKMTFQMRETPYSSISFLPFSSPLVDHSCQ